MEKFKLFELLAAFSPAEFENFGFFLNSPFLNGSPNAKSLYAAIAPYYPEFNNDRISKERIFKKLYPKETYKDKKLRDLYSRTLQLAEDFISLSKIMNEPLLMKKYALSRLSSSGLGKHFEQKAKEMETDLKKMEIKDSMYFYYNYVLQKERRGFHEYKKAIGKRERYFSDISKEIDQFILYFVSEMLYYLNTQLNQQKLIKLDAHFEFLDEILGYLEKRQLDEYPQIQIMYNIVLMLKNPEKVELFYSIKKLLNNAVSSIDYDLQVEAYIALYNYSKERELRGDKAFKKEHFNIMQVMLEKKIYPMEENFLSEHLYLSVTGEGLIHGEYEWTKNFIEEYKQLIKPEDRENAYNYCMATLQYRLKNYDKALNLLARVRTQDFYYTLRVKNHFLKIYFEMNQFDSVLNVIDSFRHFLTGNKNIPDYLGSRFLSYSNFLNRICTAIHGKDKTNLAVIREEISRSENVENRGWMKEQIDRILTSKIIL